jgi:hypothetical protein
MTPSLWLKLLHVLTGAFWFGGAAVAGLFLAATAQAIGPAAAPFMKHLIGVRKLPVFLNIAAGLNVLTGLAMYDRMSVHFSHMLVTSFHGWALTLGAMFGLIAMIWGAAVPSQAAKRLGVLTSRLTGPPTPEQAAEIAAVQKRLHMGGMVAFVLLVLTLTGMALSHPA